MAIAQEEIFGPAARCSSSITEEEVIGARTATRFGLSAYF